MRLFLRYLGSLEIGTKGSQKMWRKYFTVGNLRAVDYDEKKRYVIMRLENFRLHPLHCHILIGYIPTILQMVIGFKPSCREIKCVFRGDEYYDFI